eukprot:Awhi_evm2s770
MTFSFFIRELIPFTCDDLYCPSLKVPDCYSDPDICATDEWCQVEIHERLGPWAMGEGGSSFLDSDKSVCQNSNYQDSNDPEVKDTWNLFCQGQTSHG